LEWDNLFYTKQLKVESRKSEVTEKKTNNINRISLDKSNLGFITLDFRLFTTLDFRLLLLTYYTMHNIILIFAAIRCFWLMNAG
jgi:hypothetical protein